VTRSRLALLVCLGLVLAASITHVASAFGTLERGPVVGWLAALGIDAGIAVLMWRLMTGQAARPRWTKAGILLMAGVSAWANLDHGLTVAVDAGSASAELAAWHGSLGWQAARVVVLSVTLPALTVILAAVAEVGGAPTLAPPPPKGRKAPESSPPERGVDARARALALYDGGLSQTAIGKEMGIPRTTVQRWVTKGAVDG